MAALSAMKILEDLEIRALASQHDKTNILNHRSTNYGIVRLIWMVQEPIFFIWNQFHLLLAETSNKLQDT
jgi:hypothetical protein